MEKLHVVRDFSHSFGSNQCKLVSNGQVPINIHGVGLYYRKFFEDDLDYFEEIRTAHHFQLLTESTKVDPSHRKGIYLSKVERDEKSEDIHFNLLRCSTNLNGPTDSFRKVDTDVINRVNEGLAPFFDRPAKLNHVLAQIYENSVTTDGVKTKQRKATISTHSDKTKDMPVNGLIAFTTFYQKQLFQNGTIKSSKEDPYNFLYNNTTSSLTRLRFRLKGCVKEKKLVEKFDLVLYPNSVFIIPLYMNRVYTHEIMPSNLPVEKIPTRLGYVIRCSNTEAVFRDGKTYLKEEGNLVELKPSTPEAISELRKKYRDENLSDEIVEYGKVHFSMNDGDYKQPIL
eukprot:TRINITY_DN8874_c0_g1_i1.p1 TRINITY_DN8874_c0_g1~~TRINITY_DN8874_c0_g1_i1.p1  ORF type:complete len:341 (-),score=105.13 TRINITY_DN8874_c0_g1_i1:23-1045(-)